MTVKFPDLSHYRPGINLNLVSALITKATEGTGTTDATYAGYRDSATRRGIPFAGYHYLTTGSVSTQARHAYAVVGRHIPLMVDVEAGSGSLANLLSFINTYRGLGGLLTLAYVPHWYWQGTWGSPSLSGLKALNVALISSNYSEPYSAGGVGFDSYGGMTPTIWQYTDSFPLDGQHVDYNGFEGTIEQLRSVFGSAKPGGGTVAHDPLDANDTNAVWHSPQVSDRPWRPGFSATTLLSAAHAIQIATDEAHAANVNTQATSAQLAGLTSRVDALSAAVTTMISTGAKVNTQAIVDAINASGASGSSAVEALQAQVNDLQSKLSATERPD